MIEVKVPATSANMGPGFDCLGVALKMYNHFYIEEIEQGLEIFGCEEGFRNENNLIYTSIQHCFKLLGLKENEKGIRIRMKTEIPVSRGLGSSAACIVAGILAANELCSGKLSKNEILEIASEIEGHPDNIAPALFGGVTVSIKEGLRVYYDKVQLPQGIKFCPIIPDFTLSTKEARSVLPENIHYKDGVFNVGRVSLFITALMNKNLDLLKFACNDRLHETYRGNLIDNYREIIEESRRLNSLCVFLSGAGPTIMAVLREEETDFYRQMEGYLSKLKSKWVIREVQPDLEGAVVSIV